jgi:hypothetical protein
VICASLCKESGFLTSATNIEKGYEAEQEWVSVGAGWECRLAHEGRLGVARGDGLDVIWQLCLIKISWESAASSLACRRYRGMSHNWCFRRAAMIRWPQGRPHSTQSPLKCPGSTCSLVGPYLNCRLPAPVKARFIKAIGLSP